MDIKLYLRPSMVADYYNYECDRFLFTRFCSVVADDEHMLEADPDHTNDNLDCQSDLNPIEQAGMEWENTFFEELASKCRESAGVSFVDVREMTTSQWVDLLDSYIEQCNDRKEDLCVYMAQAKMKVDLGHGSSYEGIAVEWSQAIPDLLFIRIKYDLKQHCAQAHISVMDVKLSSTVHLSHRLQICIYSKMLEKLFEDKADVIVDTESGNVINKPYSMCMDSVIRNLTEGDIGNPIRLKGAGIIIDNFIDHKIPEALKYLYASLGEKLQSGICSGDVERCIRNAQYIVSPECKKCPNYHRCISLDQWNEESILFLPYLSKSAQRKLWELSGEYNHCFQLSRFEQLVYGDQRDGDFCSLLREDQDWNNCLYSDQTFRQSIDLLKTTYGRLRTGRKNTIRRKTNFTEYIRKTGFSLDFPKSNDISIYVYADQEYVKNPDQTIEKKVILAFLVRANEEDITYKEYECQDKDRRSELAFFEDLLAEIDAGKRHFNNGNHGNEEESLGITFFVFQDDVRSTITRLAYDLYRRSIQENDEFVKTIMTRFLNYIQDEKTVTARSNHPKTYYQNVFIAIIPEVKKMFILPGLIDYSVDSILSIFTGEIDQPLSTKEYLERLQSVVDIMKEAAADYIWGESCDYGNELSFNESGNEAGYEASIISKMYYESLFEDAVSDKSQLYKYFNNISDYNFTMAYYDPEDENSALIDINGNIIDDAASLSGKVWTRLRIDHSNGNRQKVFRMMEDLGDNSSKRVYCIETDTVNEAFKSILSNAIDQPAHSLRMKRSIDFPDYVMINEDLRGDTVKKFYIASAYHPNKHYTSDRVRSMSEKLANALTETQNQEVIHNIQRMLHPSVEEAHDVLNDENSILRIMEHGNIAHTSFTESQADALRHICAYHDSIIQGPPGTGKTDFIARSVIAIYQFLSEQRVETNREEPVRILLTSNSHAAIINIINKIYEMAEDAGLQNIKNALYKLLMKKQLSDADLRLNLDSDHLLYEYKGHLYIEDTQEEYELGDDASVIMGITPWKCFDYGRFWNHKPEGLSDFDIVIIDEASQVLLSAAFMAIGLRKAEGRTVIVGDDDQLSAIVQGDYKKEDNEIDVYHSVLDYYRDYYKWNYPDQNMVCMLSENFRMNEVLLGYSAAKIYGPRYTSFNNTIRNQRLLLSPPEALDTNIDSIVNKILDEEYPLVVCYLKGRKTHEQIAIEKYLIRKLSMSMYRRIRHRVGDDEMPYRPLSQFFGGQDDNMTPALGIVVPHNKYKDQLKYILKEDFKDIIDEREENETEEEYEERIQDTIFVGTVDKLQGQEREAIIVSYGVADPNQINREAEFIYSRNRLNVAITRAKKKMIVILPDDFAEYTLEILSRSDNKLEEGIDFVAGLREYMRTSENTSISENEVIVMPYRDENRDLEYRGSISIYRQR